MPGGRSSFYRKDLQSVACTHYFCKDCVCRYVEAWTFGGAGYKKLDDQYYEVELPCLLDQIVLWGPCRMQLFKMRLCHLVHSCGSNTKNEYFTSFLSSRVNLLDP